MLKNLYNFRYKIYVNEKKKVVSSAFAVVSSEIVFQ